MNYKKNKLFYRNVKTNEIECIEYDALLNTSPIDTFIQQIKICPELNLMHNKVKI